MRTRTMYCIIHLLCVWANCLFTLIKIAMCLSEMNKICCLGEYYTIDLRSPQCNVSAAYVKLMTIASRDDIEFIKNKQK